MFAPILHRDLWPSVVHLVHTIATQGGCIGSIFPTNLLVYCGAIYPQGKTFRYGLRGGRLCTMLLPAQSDREQGGGGGGGGGGGC